MQPFKYIHVSDARSASELLTSASTTMLLAGGTNIIDLMKEDVYRPESLIDINDLPSFKIESTSSGISIGALTKNSDTANHNSIRENFPLLSQAIVAGASAQIRNMATNGGNLNQRTRCTYFYDTAMPCNKRNPGSGCGALKGVNRMHAIFGWSEQCITVHPSDMCVALAALDAKVIVSGSVSDRTIEFKDYHRLPGDNPQKDNTLNADEIVKAIDIPFNNFAANSYYLKVRDRSSYAFALVSVAAALDLSNGGIRNARIALGGVAHKPWRAYDAETFLRGKAATEANFTEAARLSLSGAKAFEHNEFKIPMATKAVVRALMNAANGGKNN